MFIWQNKKHELCVTFSNNKPVDNPDFILNENSAKIIQAYVDDNKPICSHTYGEYVYDASTNKLIKTCTLCGYRYSKTLKDTSVQLSGITDVNGLLVTVNHVEDPATVEYKLSYVIHHDYDNVHVIKDIVSVENIQEPTGNSWKFYQFHIPFYSNGDVDYQYATLDLTITDKWGRVFTSTHSLNV